MNEDHSTQHLNSIDLTKPLRVLALFKAGSTAAAMASTLFAISVAVDLLPLSFLKRFVTEENMGYFPDFLGTTHLTMALQASLYAYSFFAGVRNAELASGFRFYSWQTRSREYFTCPRTRKGFMILAGCFFLIASIAGKWGASILLSTTGIAFLLQGLTQPYLLTFGTPEGAFIDFMAQSANKRDLLPTPLPIDIRRGLALAAIGSGVLYSNILLQAMPLKMTVLLGGTYLMTRAKYFLRPDYERLREIDQRSPVFFLRPFNTDQKLNFISTMLSNHLNEGSIEQRLARHFSSDGPFIAIGSAREGVILGATRTRFLSEWQPRVVNLMTSSSIIILMVGTTHGVDWELRKLLELHYLSKLIVVFPRNRGFRRKAMRNAATQLSAIRSIFNGTEWSLALASVGRPADLRCLVFEPLGVLTVISSRSRSLDSYHWSAMYAHYLLRRNVTTLTSVVACNIRASWQLRFIAAALDFAFVLSLSTPIILALLYRPFDLWVLGFVGFFLVLALAYHSIAEGSWGTSVGKAILGIRVSRIDGSPLGFRLALKRIVLRSTEYYRGLRDSITGTVAVRAGFSLRLRITLCLVWLAVAIGGLITAKIVFYSEPEWVFWSKYRNPGRQHSLLHKADIESSCISTG